MAQTYTKNYGYKEMSAVGDDLKKEYDWKKVEISEDSTSTKLFFTDDIAIEVATTSSYGYVRLIKQGVNIAELRMTSGYLFTKIVKTANVFCFTYSSGSYSGNISPTAALYHIIIAPATNQVTKEKETAIAYIATTMNGISGYIISSDNVSENIIVSVYPWNNANLGTKVTSIQNFFYKYSECIMKDIYILLASQLSSLSFTDCTLNGKKFYMNSTILLADD